MACRFCPLLKSVYFCGNENVIMERISKKSAVMRRAVVIGATSGIGREIALLLLKEGWRIGIAGRREERLRELQAQCPERVCVRTVDIRKPGAEGEARILVEELGGMDLFVHCSGVGHQNYELEAKTELDTVETNAAGFVRMTGFAFHYFLERGGGHVAVISSIAGTKGLGIAPAYSATKRFQNVYVDALEQLAHLHGVAIRFTDVRPGFVATDLLNDGKRYPFLMSPQKVAARVVRGIGRGRRVMVIDWRYRLLVFFWRLIPLCIWKHLPVKN